MATCPHCGFDPDRDHATLIHINGCKQRIVDSYGYMHWDPQVKPFLVVEVEQRHEQQLEGNEDRLAQEAELDDEGQRRLLQAGAPPNAKPGRHAHEKRR
jgi:hypothetical protein